MTVIEVRRSEALCEWWIGGGFRNVVVDGHPDVVIDPPKRIVRKWFAITDLIRDA